MEITVLFRNMEPSPALEAAVRTKAEKLEKLFPRIITCKVAVEASHKHHKHGTPYGVRVDMIVPGDELVVHASEQNPAHADPYIAVRDAFQSARRVLEDWVRKTRGDVKTHAA